MLALCRTWTLLNQAKEIKIYKPNKRSETNERKTKQNKKNTILLGGLWSFAVLQFTLEAEQEKQVKLNQAKEDEQRKTNKKKQNKTNERKIKQKQNKTKQKQNIPIYS